MYGDVCPNVPGNANTEDSMVAGETPVTALMKRSYGWSWWAGQT